MKFRLPWERSKPVDSQDNYDVIEEERDAMKRDIGQIKHVNRHILAKAVKDRWMEPEEAEAIRAIQMDPENGTDSSTD